MLTFYSVILEYFDAISSYYCSPLYYPYYRYYCYGYMSRGDKDLGIGLTAFLVTLACCEFFFSIGSIVVSCKAYSKCCNTCDPNDCCTCLGCCECDSYSLHTQQVTFVLFMLLLVFRDVGTGGPEGPWPPPLFSKLCRSAPFRTCPLPLFRCFLRSC